MRTGVFDRVQTSALCLIIWSVPYFGHMDVAGAQMPSRTAGSDLPPPALLKPGKFVRGPEGTLVLIPSDKPTPTMALSPNLVDMQPSTAEETDRTVDDRPLPSAAHGAMTSEVLALPPPAIGKAVTLRRLPGGELAAVPRTPRTLTVCTPQAAKPGCDHFDLAEALAQSRSGDTVLLAPGVYSQAALVTVSGITIRGEPGAHLKGRAIEGKAALVVRADDVVIEGIECSGIRVRDKNGACVRIEGRNITIRNVYFHDNEEGVLGGVGGTVLVEDSIFERNGARNGYAHGLYIGRKVELFHFRRNKVLSTKDEGQGVKSRAIRTIIEDNVIAGLDSRDSRAIDIPNGGDIVIRRNILQKGPNSSNSQMIGIGLEGSLHSVSRALVTENVIIFDQNRPEWIDRVNEYLPIAPPRGTVAASKIGSGVVVEGNVIVAAREILVGGAADPTQNRIFATRSQAGLPQFPALPNSVSEFMNK